MSTRNFTHNSNFIFGTNLFGEETTYAIQECTLPGVTFSHIDIGRQSVMGHMQGDTLVYNDLSISIIIDEELKTWKEIVQSMQQMRNPVDGNGKIIEKMGWLEIHDDNTNKILKLDFVGMMLESIDDLQYSTNSEDEIITCSIGLKYDYYTIEQ